MWTTLKELLLSLVAGMVLQAILFLPLLAPFLGRAWHLSVLPTWLLIGVAFLPLGGLIYASRPQPRRPQNSRFLPFFVIWGLGNLAFVLGLVTGATWPYAVAMLILGIGMLLLGATVSEIVDY